MPELGNAIVVGSEGAVGQAVSKRLEVSGYRVQNVGAFGIDTVGECIRRLAEAGEQLDAMVYCATSDARLQTDEVGGQAWDDLRRLNVDGVFLTIQQCARTMLASDGGRIVVVLADDAVGEDPGSPLHASTMWAARGLVRNFAQALARKGVAVNAVCAATAGSPVTPLGVVPAPDEVAELVAMLLGEGEHITGQAIPMAGGGALL